MLREAPVDDAAEPMLPGDESRVEELLDERAPEFDWEDVPEYELSQRVIVIDAVALKAGDPSQNIVVRDRDMINVPVDIGVFYMMGEVNRPGVYAFSGREITIKQAIATVGGFSAPGVAVAVRDHSTGTGGPTSRSRFQ